MLLHCWCCFYWLIDLLLLLRYFAYLLHQLMSIWNKHHLFGFQPSPLHLSKNTTDYEALGHADSISAIRIFKFNLFTEIFSKMLFEAKKSNEARKNDPPTPIIHVRNLKICHPKAYPVQLTYLWKIQPTVSFANCTFSYYLAKTESNFELWFELLCKKVSCI